MSLVKKTSEASLPPRSTAMWRGATRCPSQNFSKMMGSIQMCSAEARTEDPPPLVVVVARIVAVDRRDHGHVLLVEGGDLRLAVAHAGVVFAGDLAVHVDADQDGLARLARDRQGVLPGALEGDQAGLFPVRGSGGGPHLLPGQALALAIPLRGGDRGRVVGEEDVGGLVATQVDGDVAWRDALPVAEFLEDDGLDPDVLG
ncbi:MAG: hypothetical protein ACYSUN_11385, partial [Planctomycetota bacterium]